MRGQNNLPAHVTTVNQCVGNPGMYDFMIISPIAVKIIFPHASRAVIFLVIRSYDRKFYGQVVSGRTAVRGGAGVAGMIDLRSVAWWFGSRLPRQGWGRRRAGNCSSALRTTNYRSAKDQRAGPYVNIAGAAFGEFIVPSPRAPAADGPEPYSSGRSYGGRSRSDNHASRGRNSRCPARDHLASAICLLGRDHPAEEPGREPRPGRRRTRAMAVRADRVRRRPPLSRPSHHGGGPGGGGRRRVLAAAVEGLPDHGQRHGPAAGVVIGGTG